MDPGSKQAIEDLRDLIQVTERAVERRLGGVLPLSARAEVSHGLSRAFEIGLAYGRTRQPLAVEPEEQERPTRPPPAPFVEDYAPPATPFLGRGRPRKITPPPEKP
jgi:hypothetical protein